MPNRDLKPPFKFDLSRLLERLRALPVSIDGVTITLPFVEVSVKPNDREQKIARETVVRLADRRVLNAWECCDNCIDQALESLQEIRAVLVEKQVELSDRDDSALYILLDSIRDAIRQFLTFEQRLERRRKSVRDSANRDIYFAGLEMLRAHIHKSLIQISKIARMEIPGISKHMRYSDDWPIDMYERLP